MESNLSIENVVKFLGRKGYLFLFAALLLLLALIMVGACVVLTIKTSPTPADFMRLFADFTKSVLYLFGIACSGNAVEHVTGIFKTENGDQTQAAITSGELEKK